MKLKKIETLYKGFMEIQGVTFENDEGERKVFERCKCKPGAIAICHDPINDTVMLVKQYRVGAMQSLLEFPAGIVEDGEEAHQAVAREVLEETGCYIKSSTMIQEYMSSPSTDYSPVSIFYCTFDSRQAEQKVFTTGPFESTEVVLYRAGDLIREVEDMAHPSVPVIIGAQYLKLLRHKLIK